MIAPEFPPMLARSRRLLPVCISAVAAFAATTAAAQYPRIWVGGGMGITQSDRLSGSAYHVSTTVEIIRLTESLAGAVDGFYQGGTMGSGPFACVEPRAGQCLGRTDRNRIAGLSLQLRETLFGDALGFPVVAAAGGGIYRRWTRSTESWAVGSDFTTSTSSAERSSVGYSVGAGVTATRWMLDPSVMIQAHDLLENDSKAGSVLITAGIRVR